MLVMQSPHCMNSDLILNSSIQTAISSYHLHLIKSLVANPCFVLCLQREVTAVGELQYLDCSQSLPSHSLPLVLYIPFNLLILNNMILDWWN